MITREFLQEVRGILLQAVDLIERFIGKEPRTSELRRAFDENKNALPPGVTRALTESGKL